MQVRGSRALLSQYFRGILYGKQQHCVVTFARIRLLSLFHNYAIYSFAQYH